MLQQTQVARVLPYYEAWLARWPTLAFLSESTAADAIDAWGGLGYNRRALYLHRIACELAAAGTSELPATFAELVDLPGVGRYTATAILSFAREEPVAVVDTNVARVLARAVLGAGAASAVAPPVLLATAEAIVPDSGARDQNLALMDLGAVVCTARSPTCDSCPLSEHCAWYRAGRPAVESPRRASRRFEDTARFARGRLVAALREHPALPTKRLEEQLPAQHREHVNTYLDALARDGVVEQQASGIWSLAGRRLREG